MMKIVSTLLLTTILHINAMAQNIEGLGQFKINRTTSFNVIDSLKNDGYKFLNDTTSAEFPIDRYLVAKTAILYNPSALKKFKQIAFPDAVVSGMKIEQLYLYFYADTLIAIKFHYLKTKSDLIHQFTNKYKKYKSSDKERFVDCRTGFGVEYREKETEYYYDYQIVNGIKTNAYTKYLYNYNCQLYTESELFIRAAKKYAIVEPTLNKITDYVVKKNSGTIQSALLAWLKQKHVIMLSFTS